MTILSLVGKQMRNLVGMSGRMFQTLAQGNVNIEMISQGASEINISCVIQARDAVKALNLIHQSCLQIKPEGVRGRESIGWIVDKEKTFCTPFTYHSLLLPALASRWTFGYPRSGDIVTRLVSINLLFVDKRERSPSWKTDA
ncbi:hypothetical protein J3R83DRAFT_10267 [Lanmaoa asiatica]|nr:hypothetical protein J3R83DRAFT_10267 [Lanmaoa asiatica]